MNDVDMLDKNALIDEVEANLWETWSKFGCGPGCCLHDEGDALWFETPIPIIPYNTVLKFQVEENIEQRIDRLVNHLNNRQVPFFWIVHPSSRPLDLPVRLERRGLREIELMPGMAKSLADLPEPPPLPNGIQVRKVAVARTEGDLTIVASGVKPGERVVTRGQLRLSPGVKVVVRKGTS